MGSLSLPASIVIIVLIGFVTGLAAASLYWIRRERRLVRYDIEYRKKFGSQTSAHLATVDGIVAVANSPSIKVEPTPPSPTNSKLPLSSQNLNSGPLQVGYHSIHASLVGLPSTISNSQKVSSSVDSGSVLNPKFQRTILQTTSKSTGNPFATVTTTTPNPYVAQYNKDRYALGTFSPLRPPPPPTTASPLGQKRHPPAAAAAAAALANQQEKGTTNQEDTIRAFSPSKSSAQRSIVANNNKEERSNSRAYKSLEMSATTDGQQSTHSTLNSTSEEAALARTVSIEPKSVSVDHVPSQGGVAVVVEDGNHKQSTPTTTTKKNGENTNSKTTTGWTLFGERPGRRRSSSQSTFDDGDGYETEQYRSIGHNPLASSFNLHSSTSGSLKNAPITTTYNTEQQKQQQYEVTPIPPKRPTHGTNGEKLVLGSRLGQEFKTAVVSQEEDSGGGDVNNVISKGDDDTVDDKGGKEEEKHEKNTDVQEELKTSDKNTEDDIEKSNPFATTPTAKAAAIEARRSGGLF